MQKCIHSLIALLISICILPHVMYAESSTKHPPSSKPDIKSDQLSAKLVQATDMIDSYVGDTSKLEGAKKILDEILQKNPRYAPAHRELSRYFIRSGHISYHNFQAGSLEAAEASLKKAMEINPIYAEAYVLAGHLYRLMKRPNEAKAALTKADELESKDLWLQNNWADILLDEGRVEEAAQRYQKVIDSAIRDRNTGDRNAKIAAFEGLTRFYLKAGRLDEADTIFKKAIAYEPQRAWNYGNYAEFLLCQRDDFNAAITQATLALQIMNYGAGQRILASSLYRKWADQILKRQTDDAKETLAKATLIVQATPAQIVGSVCGDCPAFRATLRAASPIPAK